MVATILHRMLSVALCVVAVIPAAAQGQEIMGTLLGTGCPPPVMHRFGPSTLVEAGGHKLLFDAGRGALHRLTQLKVQWQEVQGVFLTHLHSDHVVGFPELWLTGWLVGPGRHVPLQVWGPRGTRKMMAHLEQACEFDIRMRLYDDRAAPDWVVLLAEDIREGVVYDQGGVKITAFEVDHAPVKTAFGYRIDYAGRSVVLSDDTRVSENLIRHAQGVDVLVHEVAAPDTFQRAGVPPERAKSVVAHHVTPEQAGEGLRGRSQNSQCIRTSSCRSPRSRSDSPDAQGPRGTVGTRRGFDGDRSRRKDRDTATSPLVAVIMV